MPLDPDLEPDDEKHARGEDIPTKGEQVKPPETPADKALRESFALIARLKAEHDAGKGEAKDLIARFKLAAMDLSAAEPLQLRAAAPHITAAMDSFDARGNKTELPLSTPWPDLNEQLPGGGYWPGCHVLVGGTGAGKSAWALQLAMHALTDGAAVYYAALELDTKQIIARLAAESDAQLTQAAARKAGKRPPRPISWSSLYTGEASAEERMRAREALPAGALANFTIDHGGDDGEGGDWTPGRMRDAAAAMRKQHGDKPILMIVDFLQLVASDGGSRMELRERIGHAAKTARAVAQRYGATVMLISSVARDKYDDVSSFQGLKAARIGADRTADQVVERYLHSPDALVGLGKESGEIEYAADSVTTAVTLPRVPALAGRPVVFVTAKLRAGRPGWCSLQFDGSRFTSEPDRGAGVLRAMNDQPKTPKAKPGGQSNADDDDNLKL